MEIVTQRVTELKGYENNARTHSDAQIGEIIDSIKNYGFNDPIEVGPDLVIISGHARVVAALKMGLNEVPTITHAHLKSSKRKGYILAANRIAMSAGWDHTLVGEELRALRDDNFDLKLTGFTDEEIEGSLRLDEINEPAVDEDTCGGLTAETTSKTGDVWLLGDHRLMCGDSVNMDDVEKLIVDHKIEMVFTDPPYGINEKTDRVRSKRTQAARAGVYDKIIGDDSIQTAIDAYNLCETLEIPVMVFWGANYYCHSLPQTANRKLARVG